MGVVKRNIFNQSSLLAASLLLGKILIRRLNNKILSERIVEVEAYLSIDDEASHGYRGRTKSNDSMFGEKDLNYIYHIHNQLCLNVVTEGPGIPSAILIRALEPLEGIELMKDFRKKDNLIDLTSGPCKLTKALNITLDLNKVDLTHKDSNLYIYDDSFNINKDSIIKTKRIGVTKAKELELRFFIKDNKFISRK